MSSKISFNNFESVKKNYANWWNNKIDRPIVWVSLKNKIPNRLEPELKIFNQESFADLSIPSLKLAERVIFDLESTTWLGDGYPYVNFDISGPGIVSAFLGADLTINNGNIWFEQIDEKDLKIEKIKFDPENIWLKRLMELYKIIIDQTEGKVVPGMPDLGGILDILANLRGSENLLMDLYDNPDDIKQYTEKLLEIWFEYYDYLYNFISKKTNGISDWSKAYSDKKSYIIQSDFSYMIGPEMFNEFVYDDISASTKKLENSIYHLDGIGQLAHLDKLCKLDGLNCIQWIPGDGQQSPEMWVDVLKKIRNSKKVVHLYGNSKTLNKLKTDFGSLDGFMMVWNYDSEYNTEYEIQKLLNKYNVQ